MQTNELKNAVATPRRATPRRAGGGGGHGEARALADDLTLSKVNQCPPIPRPNDGRRPRDTGRAHDRARRAVGPRSGPAPPASFRQFFKIKSLSVLVKRACRAQPVSNLPVAPPDPLSCPALPCVLPLPLYSSPCSPRPALIAASPVRRSTCCA